jgi:hypothetical protein
MSWLGNIWNRLCNPRMNDSWVGPGTDFEQEKTAAKLLIASGIKFHLQQCADGRTRDGGRTYFNMERSSDGVWIDSSGVECKTPQTARKIFEQQLRGYKVLIRVPELEPSGHQVGERAVAVKATGGGRYKAIIAVYGPTHCANTSATSLSHLLAYKREWLS